MTALAHRDPLDVALSGDVRSHLDAQLISARRLLEVVLKQSAAIRQREVKSVVALTGLLHVELQRRGLIEQDRARLLERAGARLGIAPGGVTLGLLESLMDPESADGARARSAELRGLLEQIQREHYCNRVLMNQELAFLDHLLGLADSDRKLGYNAAGDRQTARPMRSNGQYRVLDMEV